MNISDDKSAKLFQQVNFKQFTFWKIPIYYLMSKSAKTKQAKNLFTLIYYSILFIIIQCHKKYMGVILSYFPFPVYEWKV